MRDLYPPGRIGWSFEIYPPKTAEGEEALYSACRELLAFSPVFLSITYGAGGSTREKSLEIAERLIGQGANVTAHLTCVGSSQDQLRAWLGRARSLGVRNIMALRGDPPAGQSAFTPPPGGLRYASELVSLIRREYQTFGIGVAGYPETHQEAHSPQADLENLKRKVDLGGDVVYTQLFYDNADFLRFREESHRAGIQAPIVPGLLPILSLKQIQRITSLCKARLPVALIDQLLRYADDPAGQMAVGVEHCTRQVEELRSAGVPGIHFYVLNRSDCVRRILHNVGVQPPRST